MDRDPERFAAATRALHSLETVSEGEALHEYTAVLEDTGEPVRVISLAPGAADTDVAVDAFIGVADQWSNASANAAILPVLERGTEPRPWIAVPGDRTETLATVRSDFGPDGLRTVVTESADALRTLGLYNTVHGALSPDDIYLGGVPNPRAELTVEVGGFGLEAAVRAAVDEYEATPYTAPELTAGSSQPTEQTDVYGLGAVAFFALTGQPPVDGADLVRAIRDGPPVPPSECADGIPAALDAVVMQALSTRPADRYDSPYAFHRAFMAAFDVAAFESDAEADDDPVAEIEESSDGSGDQNREPAEDDSQQTPGAARSTEERQTPPSEGAADDGQPAVDDPPSNNEGQTPGKADSHDISHRTVSRRAALSVLAVGAIGGTGLFLTRDRLGLLGNAADEAPQTPAGNRAEGRKLLPDDGDSGDSFGRAVALSSDATTAIIGAARDTDPNRDGAGSAYVFGNDGGRWTQRAKVAPVEEDGGGDFGRSVAVSSDGTTALVGAPKDSNSNGGGAGAAYVYESEGNSWVQRTKLTSEDGDTGDEFGGSVAISSDGTTAIIGALRTDDPHGNYAGAAYVFERDSGLWSERATLVSDEIDSRDLFGASVAVSSDGTTAVVGASQEGDSTRIGAGSAYVFDGDAGTWDQRATLTPDDANGRDRVGGSLAISDDGTTAVIGAWRADTSDGENAGSAYVFDLNGGQWSQRAKLTPDDGDSDDFFGRSVAISADGTVALVGAWHDDNSAGVAAGSAYVFGTADGSWLQQIQLTAANGDGRDSFGRSVALSGDTVALVGAHDDEDPNGEDAGSAHVFTL